MTFTDLGGGRGFAYAIVGSPTASSVVAGESDGKFALVRYQASGALDTSFGTGGIVLTSISARDYDPTGARAAVLQADSAVIAAGRVPQRKRVVALALARYEGGRAATASSARRRGPRRRQPRGWRRLRRQLHRHRLRQRPSRRQRGLRRRQHHRRRLLLGELLIEAAGSRAPATATLHRRRLRRSRLLRTRQRRAVRRRQPVHRFGRLRRWRLRRDRALHRLRAVQ